jgi:phosphatidylinositol glycan class V
MFCKVSDSELSDIPKYLVEYGLERGYHIIGDSVPVWCQFTIPFSYTEVQSTHWGVGFMKYYQFKQIPNFLLAMPGTIISTSCVVCYYMWNKQTCWTLGIKSDRSDAKKSDDGCRCLWNNPRLLPYVVHVLVLTVFGWMFVHIQVCTSI